MSGKYVKMGPQEFLDTFVEAPIGEKEPMWKNAFNKVVNGPGVKEADLCESVLKEINKRTICPGHKVIGTPHRADPHNDSRQKVDGGLYPNERTPEDNRNSWADQLVSFEWKREDVSDDPFDDSSAEFEATSEKRQKNRGQIISYASEVLLRQHRCFHYTVVIFGVYARIIRWDRSGAVVTEKFDYTMRPRYLCRFLWRFCQLSPEKQGLDPTAVRIEEGSDDWTRMDRVAATKSDELKALEEARREKAIKNSKRTKRRGKSKKQKETPQEQEEETPQEKQAWLDAQHADFARQCFEESLASDWPRWRLTVCDEPADALGGDSSDAGASDASSSSTRPSGKASRDFLVCKPHFKTPGVAGRGTRGYIAIDCETGELVFLKDAWRVDLDDIMREGDVLEHLASKGVQNIPTVLCHGDVRGQCTVTYEFEQREAAHPMKKHAHYRLVEKEIGFPLSDFEHGCYLLKVLLDCLYAHRDAVEKANILHRDISAGNILMIYKHDDELGCMMPFGLLNDWELSKELPPPNSGSGQASSARQPDRTGTWQFMSAASLNDANKQMVVQDDLESFLYVLLYFALRFLPNNHPNVPSFMRHFFDGAYDGDGVYRCGLVKMMAMQSGAIEWKQDRHTKKRLQFLYSPNAEIPHPLNDIISTLLQWFAAYHRVEETYVSDYSARATPAIPKRPVLKNPWHKSRKGKERLDQQIVGDSIPAFTDSDVALAAKLTSHDAMCELFDSVGALPEGWPADDKTSDQLRDTINNQVLPTVQESNAEGPTGQMDLDADLRRRRRTPEPVLEPPQPVLEPPQPVPEPPQPFPEPPKPVPQARNAPRKAKKVPPYAGDRVLRPRPL
ncbi:hypothetical protein B0H21DRAFT_891271 [Amylocystis lapponica]|nr:hypothetical protein B0H21DRAFT_891271 [Amylocystis lapponica]